MWSLSLSLGVRRAWQLDCDLRAWRRCITRMCSLALSLSRYQLTTTMFPLLLFASSCMCVGHLRCTLQLARRRSRPTERRRAATRTSDLPRTCAFIACPCSCLLSLSHIRSCKRASHTTTCVRTQWSKAVRTQLQTRSNAATDVVAVDKLLIAMPGGPDVFVRELTSTWHTVATLVVSDETIVRHNMHCVRHDARTYTNVYMCVFIRWR